MCSFGPRASRRISSRKQRSQPRRNCTTALTKHPELIPASDIGMGSTVVVGRESGLASGYADLVLVDERGRLCVVEVKNEGNPDTRRVVAQLLDYAASLWGLTVDDFEQRVLHPLLSASGHPAPLPAVAEHVAETSQRGAITQVSWPSSLPRPSPPGKAGWAAASDAEAPLSRRESASAATRA